MNAGSLSIAMMSYTSLLVFMREARGSKVCSWTQTLDIKKIAATAVPAT